MIKGETPARSNAGERSPVALGSRAFWNVLGVEV